jgi:hypothetical protein
VNISHVKQIAILTASGMIGTHRIYISSLIVMHIVVISILTFTVMLFTQMALQMTAFMNNTIFH